MEQLLFAVSEFLEFVDSCGEILERELLLVVELLISLDPPQDARRDLKDIITQRHRQNISERTVSVEQRVVDQIVDFQILGELPLEPILVCAEIELRQDAKLLDDEHRLIESPSAD